MDDDWDYPYFKETSKYKSWLGISCNVVIHMHGIILESGIPTEYWLSIPLAIKHGQLVNPLLKLAKKLEHHRQTWGDVPDGTDWTCLQTKLQKSVSVYPSWPIIFEAVLKSLNANGPCVKFPLSPLAITRGGPRATGGNPRAKCRWGFPKIMVPPNHPF